MKSFAGNDGRVFVTENGTTRLHPDRFGWGRDAIVAGPGVELAKAVLVEHLGSDEPRVTQYARRLAWRWVANLRGSWTITGQQIDGMLADMESSGLSAHERAAVDRDLPIVAQEPPVGPTSDIEER